MINYVYKTINMVNGKYYIGVKTGSRHIDDAYFGSGHLLHKAIKKYGIENFRKEILWNFSTPEECFEKEREIVTEELVRDENCYNVALGGKGGYLGDAVNEKRKQSLKGHLVSQETKDKLSKSRMGQPSPRKGVSLSEETKNKLSITRKTTGVCDGENNPMYGRNHTDVSKNKMRKPHKSTGPKTRVSCIHCKKNTTVNAFWHHKSCSN